MKINILKIIFAIILLGIFLPKPSSAQEVSNLLPAKLVEEIVNEGLWHSDLDNPNSEDSKNIIQFWTSLNVHNSASIDPIVDLMFDFDNNSKEISVSGQIQNISSNPIMVKILRFAKVQSKNTTQILNIEKKWIIRYIELANNVIKMAGIPDLIKMSNTFMELIHNGKIKIVDLSPIERSSLAKSMSASHGVSILEKFPQSNSYKITGLYNHHLRYFAIDFGRSIEDTLITFAHEMVHATDSYLDEQRNLYISLLPKVMSILASKIPKEQAEKIIDLDSLKSLFFESQQSEIAEITLKMRQTQVQIVQQAVANQELFSAEEKIVLKDWLRSGIAITLENEYRAYGFSMVLFSALKNKFNYVLSHSTQYTNFLNRFISGDDVFLVGMLSNSSANSGPKAPILKVLSLDKESEELTSLEKAQVHMYVLYEDVLANFIQDINNKFSSSIKEYIEGANAADSILPKWAQKGNLFLETNPYTILSARLTTSMVAKFKNYLEQIHQKISGFAESLTTLRAGILDLHDTTRQDLILIGVHYLDSEFQQMPAGHFVPVEQELVPYAQSPETFKQKEKEYIQKFEKYFTTYSFDRSLIYNPNAQITQIKSSELIRNILGLKLLKANDWLSSLLPVWISTVEKSNVFISKIKSGVDLDTDGMSEERLEQLREEITNNLEKANYSAQEFSYLRIVFEQVQLLYNIAENEKFFDLAANFNKKSRDVLATLQMLGVDTVGFSDPNQKLQSNLVTLEQQLHAVQAECLKLTKQSDTNWRTHLIRKSGISIPNYQSFPLSVACFRGNIFPIRQPGDFIDFMTLQVKDSFPVARIFFGSRDVVLDQNFYLQTKTETPKPVVEKKPKKKWGKK